MLYYKYPLKKFEYFNFNFKFEICLHSIDVLPIWIAVDGNTNVYLLKCLPAKKNIQARIWS